MKNKETKSHKRWVIMIVFWTFVLSAISNAMSNTLLSEANVVVAFIILIVIVSIGIVFDIIGTAVTSATDVQFHAMAARKVKGAKGAINLVHNAEKVANFCNDVVGDIAGVVSGGAAVVIAEKIFTAYPLMNAVVINLVMGALVASLTVGGKAMGKSFAINKSNDIVYWVAKVTSVFNKDKA